MKVIPNKYQLLLDKSTLVDTSLSSGGVHMASDVHSAKISYVGEGSTIAKVNMYAHYHKSSGKYVSINNKDYVLLSEQLALYFVDGSMEAIDKTI